MSHLVPCPGCLRHVRARDEACPFCAAALPEALRASLPPPRPAQRLGRSALFAFTASLAASVAAGCGDSEVAEPESEDTTGNEAVAIYGAPAPPPDTDGNPDETQVTPEEPQDPTAPVAAYGAPAPP